MMAATGLIRRFEQACAGLAVGIELRPGGLAVCSPGELQQLWSDACALAGIDRVSATVLLNRINPLPAYLPADGRLLLIAALTDYAEIVRLSDWAADRG
jgi:hypothetical protein